MRTQLKKEKKRKLFPVPFWHFDESSVFSYVLEPPLLVIMTSEEEVGRAGEAGWVGRCSAVGLHHRHPMNIRGEGFPGGWTMMGISIACLADKPEQIRKTAGRDCVKATSPRGASFPVQTPDPATQGQVCIM